MNLIKIKEPSINEDSKLCIGIDFGTTNSVCTVKFEDDIKVVQDNLGKTIIPTLVLYNNHKSIFGNNALEHNDYLDSVFSVKRDFTSDYDVKKYFNSNSEKVSPVEVSKDFFIYLKNTCEQYLNKKIFDCVVTVPAYYDEKARSGIMRAAFMAGLRVRRLINEPTSAAFAYGLEKKKKGVFFIYDLGGGTFDVSLLKLSEGIFKVMATGGDPNLGGDDFDRLFADYVLKSKLNIGIDDISDKDRIRLTKQCKSIKENLQNTESLEESFEINGNIITARLSLEEFNNSVEDLVNKTMKISKDLLDEVDIPIENINGFVLVGGSTKVNLISEKLKTNFKTNIFNDIDPDFVVSKGAALHGYELLNGPKNILLDVTPLSLGLETMGGLMEKIISRNSPIPSIKDQLFTTHENGQTAIQIKVLQGERETSNKNRCLGEFILSNIPPKPAGIPRIKVIFSLDADGILYVSAKDEESGSESDISLKTNENLDLAEMRSIVESSILNAKDDMEQRMLIESKIKAKTFLNEISSVKKDIELLCSKNDIKDIEFKMKELEKVLKTNDCDLINESIDILNKSTESFAQKRIEKDFSEVVGKDVEEINNTE